MVKKSVNKKLILIVVLFMAILGVQIYLKTVTSQPSRIPELKKFYTVPEFSLVNTSGDSIGLDRFLGKIWIADFIFTRCGGPCPIMTRNMAKLQKSLIGRDVHFMSVTVNPDYDTPEVLANYIKEFEVDTKTWEFLTGTFEAIQSLAVQGFKLSAGDIKDLATHSNRFVLIDKQGIVRGYYEGTSPEGLMALKKDLHKLLIN